MGPNLYCFSCNVQLKKYHVLLLLKLVMKYISANNQLHINRYSRPTDARFERRKVQFVWNTSHFAPRANWKQVSPPVQLFSTWRNSWRIHIYFTARPWSHPNRVSPIGYQIKNGFAKFVGEDRYVGYLSRASERPGRSYSVSATLPGKGKTRSTIGL